MIVKSAEWQRLALDNSLQVASRVSAILGAVREGGDSAVANISEEIDGFTPEVIELQPFASYGIESKLGDAIQSAANRVENFAQRQKSCFNDLQFSDAHGEFGHQIKPIERMAAYIPGGRFPLISTALMTLIPARVAGCVERIACSPSQHPAVLAAASLAGATGFYRIGGAQAIAALSVGFQGNAPADIVVGPGNQYVNEAKAQIQKHTRIDSLAGPSELLVLADEMTNARWLISDALAQAEHDPQAQSVIVSTSAEWLNACIDELRQRNAEAMLNSRQIELILAESRDDMIRFSDNYAPEHLLLAHRAITADDLNHYGSLFLGENSAVAFGDYCSGPNHTLPTSGQARTSGGLQVGDFLRVLSYQKITNSGREKLGEIAQCLAEAEGLTEHARSAAIRR